MIYFTSDLHFCHNRNFIYEDRGCLTVYEMNKRIVNNFQKTLTWEDELFILGDVMLNDNEEGIKLLKQIPGKKHIIIGNHDTTNRIEKYGDIWNVDVVGYSIMFKYNKWHFYLSHYPVRISNYDENRKRRTYCLCGHTHTKDKFADMDDMCSYHVEVDAHNLFPISIEDIITDIQTYNKERS